ncbi:MAG: alanine dehydrogenase [Chlorobi bacterium]|nr:alanine dehydrogenase [Chlorobiota bacterium]
MKIGILRETKIPPDRRVPLIPSQVKRFLDHHPGVSCVVQPGPDRCFRDQEYRDEGIRLSESLEDCDLLMGVKEVSTDTLIPEKSYMFFSHTAKKQSYNRKLLQEIIKKKITLIDYEYLTDENHNRLVAFGKWAGIVGAYNGLRAWGERTGDYHLKPAHRCHDRQEMTGELRKVKLPPIKILITGGGRVAHGAMETLNPLGLKQVAPEDFLTRTYDKAVICRLDPDHYVHRKDHGLFELKHFFSYPDQYYSVFFPYTQVTDMLIACHYWDPASPVFIEPEDYLSEGFKIKVIADVSCDIGKPIPSTLRAATIAEPFYGYNPKTRSEDEPFSEDHITVMAVDNLPGELPRDSSEDFGNMLLEKVLPSLIGDDTNGIIKRATIAADGKLKARFIYLQDYLEGR